eukprot:7142969-Prymnesium_polylepis.1
MDASINQTMWSLMQGSAGGASDDIRPDVLKYHSDDKRCRVEIDGSRLGFFEVGWLELGRTKRHLYEVSWKKTSKVTSARNNKRVLVANSDMLTTTKLQRFQANKVPDTLERATLILCKSAERGQHQ